MIAPQRAPGAGGVAAAVPTISMGSNIPAG
jgi:hypothetical protein